MTVRLCAYSAYARQRLMAPCALLAHAASMYKVGRGGTSGRLSSHQQQNSDIHLRQILNHLYFNH
jgi:hypothetical protein